MMHTILKYLPYVLLFAVATMIVYGWGLWRTMRQGSDLTAKQPFMQEQINVTNPRQFLDSILPYMVKQKMITEEKVNGKIVYQIRKD